MTELLCAGCLHHDKKIPAVTVARGYALCVLHAMSPQIGVPSISDEELRRRLFEIEPAALAYT